MAQQFQENFNTILRPPLQIDPIQQQLQQQQQQSAQYPTPVMHPNTSMPWSIENMPWAQPVGNSNFNQIMHFQAPSNFLDERERRSLLHVKRRSDPAPAAAPPSKQFITEEKITAHFNGLHISNSFAQNQSTSLMSSMDDDTAVGSSSTSFANYQDYRISAKELEEKLKNANRITLCEDFKKLQEEQKKASLTTLIPEALMNHIEKPCTALVLWQPPPILELLHRKNDEELRKVNEQNNDELISTMDINDEKNLIEDVEFCETDDVDDFIDNNNTCRVDYNKFNGDMDEDL